MPVSFAGRWTEQRWSYRVIEGKERVAFDQQVSMAVFTQVTGMEEFRQNLQRIPENVRAAALRALKKFVTEVWHQSLNEVPYDTGALFRSAYVTYVPPATGEWFPTYEIGYRTESVWYTWLVHEDPFPRHEPPTKWRYLADPFNQQAHKLEAYLREETQRAFDAYMRGQAPDPKQIAAEIEASKPSKGLGTIAGPRLRKRT